MGMKSGKTTRGKRMKHTAEYYEKLMDNLHLTLHDMARYLHSYTSHSFKPNEVIDYLVAGGYSAKEIRYITSIQ